MRTVFEQADVGLLRSSRRSKMSSNCRAAFPGHLRTRNAKHARAALAGSLLCDRVASSSFLGGCISFPTLFPNNFVISFFDIGFYFEAFFDDCHFIKVFQIQNEIVKLRIVDDKY
jgi:hypothetical protein